MVELDTLAPAPKGGRRGVRRRGNRDSFSRFAVRRIASSLLLVAVLLVTPFLVVRLLPGDPVVRLAGPDATPQFLDELRVELKLDRPFSEQFITYLSDVIRLDFGQSFATREPVTDIISDRLPYTMNLVLLGLFFAFVVGVLGGLTAAVLTRSGRRVWFDRAFVAGSGAAGVIPEVVYGTLLVAVFAVHFQWFPISGVSGGAAWLLLPALAVGVRPGFNLARIIRTESLVVLRQQYMLTAASKRLPLWRRYLVHAGPNIATATLTLTSLLFAYLLGGTVVTENLFALPGVGSALVQGVLARDYPVVQGLLVLLGLFVVTVNLAADLLIAAIDRRTLQARYS